jgi:DNA-directed RNA polymerase II subunit RPB1
MEFNMQMYDEKIRPVNNIEFNILKNEEIKKFSALGKDSIGVDIPDLYDNMEPKRGGLIDPRLGVTNNTQECQTCGLNSIECVGHWGHIDLVEPVFIIGYIDYIKKILSMVCLRCSRILTHKNEELTLDMLKTKTGKSRFNAIKDITKGVTNCAHCGTPVSKIKKEEKKSTGVLNLVSELIVADEGEADKEKKKLKHVLTPDICYDILKLISDSDCEILGIDPKKSRPEDMINKIFPVPPVAIRPSAKVDFLDISTKEDDLTHKLADIVKANIRIRKYKESSGETVAKYSQDHIHLLQYHVAVYYNNETLSLPKSEKGNKPSTSLVKRLKGKDGRIRSNLMGKRVDACARTVITSDPTIDINQIGVPKKVAMTLTFPETVTPENHEYLSNLVKNGRNKYPGANFVFPANNEKGEKVFPIDLRFCKEDIELKYGDTVERHIVDDDYVLFNRQPTLHKLSMMGHRIKVLEDDDLSTFRLNAAVTRCYNADFDG